MTEIKTSLSLPSDVVLEICRGDITLEETDAIVNAANAQLMHGGGVAAAIARRGGQAIWEESRQWVRQHGPVSHSQPAYTSGGDMRCRYVIHAVGPSWGEGSEKKKLAQAISGCLDVACQLGLQSISFPAISTGIYGFPIKDAAMVFRDAIYEYFTPNKPTPLRLIRLVLFDEKTAAEFVNAFQPTSLHES